MGGTGKTPVVQHIIRKLLDLGHTPAIAMRGYRKSTTTTGLSDEQAEQQRRFPTVPVVAQPDRLAGLHQLFTTHQPPITAVVLDDGFQHRTIARNLDIVLIDATRPPFNDRCLPAGWLREPLAALARANAFVITHAELVSNNDINQLRAQLRASNPAAPIFTTWHAWKHLSDQSDNQLPLTWLASKRVIAACAIGNPAAFLASAQYHSEQPRDSATEHQPTQPTTGLAGAVVLKDHDPYTDRTINKIINAAQAANAHAIIVTEKDWSKLARTTPNRWPCPILRPALAVEFINDSTPTTPSQTFDQLITNTVQNPSRHQHQTP